MSLYNSLLLLLLAGYVLGHEETDLRNELMEDYNKNAMPATLTNVTVRFTILHLDMNELKQTMELDAWISMEWEDPRLTWSEEDYPDIEKLTFPRDQVWTPDFTLYNNAQMDKHNPMGMTLVLAYPTGKMLHIPMALVQASCILDMTYWPNDVHDCRAKFGSWVHSGNIIDLIPKDDDTEVELEMIQKTQDGNTMTRGSWEILNNTVSRNVKYYACCPEPYVDLSVNFTVKRNAPAYNWVVKVPVIAICLLTGILFLLPPASVEKILMGAFIVVIEMQFLAYTKDVVLHSPTHTPLIVELIGEQLVLTLVCIFVSVFIVRLVRDPHTDGLPSWLQRPMSAIATCFCLSGYRKLVTGSVDGSYPRSIKGEELEMAEERGMIGGSGKKDQISAEQAEWLLLGAILDRLFLFLYIIDIVCKLVIYKGIL